MIRAIATDLLAAAGGGAICYGLWRLHPSAGLVALGLMVLAISFGLAPRRAPVKKGRAG